MDLDQLKRHLDEDERVALAAGGDSWRATGDGVFHPDDSHAFVVGLDDNEGAHIARFDPAWALRWVRAAREILAEHGQTPTSCYHCARNRSCPTVRSFMPVYEGA